jgi:putative membrane protein
MRWTFALLHLLALGIGLGAIWARARALRSQLDSAGVRRVLAADTWWGLAALLWISTGLVRLLAGLEKTTAYYMSNYLFWTKMALLLLILLLEIGPMMAFIRWRVAIGRAAQPELSKACRYATISYIEAVLVALMIVAATGMARGYGSR